MNLVPQESEFTYCQWMIQTNILNHLFLPFALFFWNEWNWFIKRQEVHRLRLHTAFSVKHCVYVYKLSYHEYSLGCWRCSSCRGSTASFLIMYRAKLLTKLWKFPRERICYAAWYDLSVAHAVAMNPTINAKTSTLNGEQDNGFNGQV